MGKVTLSNLCCDLKADIQMVIFFLVNLVPIFDIIVQKG